MYNMSSRNSLETSAGSIGVDSSKHYNFALGTCKNCSSLANWNPGILKLVHMCAGLDGKMLIIMYRLIYKSIAN